MLTGSEERPLVGEGVGSCLSPFFSGAIDTCLALTFDLCAGTSSPSIMMGSVDTALLLCLVTGFFNLSAMSVAK